MSRSSGEYFLDPPSPIGEGMAATHVERPLHEFIDMEAYDVVSGEQYRALKEALANTAVRKDGDGELCWCTTPLRSGLHLRQHAEYCVNARRFFE